MVAENPHTVCLVDGSGYIFRAFYALPMMTRPDGVPVNAVYGFMNMLMQLIGEKRCAHIVVVFDAKRKNFRNEIYPAYKATRREVPEELIPQFPLIRDVCRVLNVPQIEMEGYEADDLIATYAKQATEKGWHAQVISADKDLMQLMRENVSLYDPMKHKEITLADVEAKFGVLPEKVIDVQALMGDSTDNVPGAGGIGPKTAAELIGSFGSVENLYEHIDEIKSSKRKETLLRDKEKVFISKRLVALDDNVPVQTPIESFVAQLPNQETLQKFLTENNFKSLIKKMNGWIQKQADFLSDSPVNETRENTDTTHNPTAHITVQSADFPDKEKGNPQDCSSAILQNGHPSHTDTNTPLTEAVNTCNTLPLFATTASPIAPNQEANASVCETPTNNIIFVQTQQEWADCCEQVNQAKEFAFLVHTLPSGATNQFVLTFFLRRKVFYVPLTGDTSTDGADLFLFQSQQNNGITQESAFKQVAQWLSHPAVHVITYRLKETLHLLYQALHQVIIPNHFDDILLQNYVLNGTRNSSKLADMATRELGFEIPLPIKGKSKKELTVLSLEEQTAYRETFIAEINAVHHLYDLFYRQLKQCNSEAVYTEIERPLLPILFQMETNGILIDKLHLSRLNLQFTQEIDQTLNQIYELAGEEFNVNSPAQIAMILFDKMGLQGGRKSAKGNLSTDVKVLEKLAEDGVEIARLILRYRQFGKLKSTYVDALLKLADKNNRVHTTFLQTVTNTGRLSSADPNLQNIPVRTKEGKEIRKAFIARPGYKLVCADYSQIELRLMADVAHVTELKNSFIHNEDIHARTASQIFKIPLAQIDADTRRRAKAINFGIIYGISAFGLSNQLGISRADAGAYINAYFEHYPEIKAYMNQIEAFVKENGYVKTPFGRICYIPEVNQPKLRSFAVRAAINAPIQGGAADIIKLAMKAIDTALTEQKSDATLLLQVHDELVFEVKESDVERVMQLVKEKMETVVQLSVPLIADVRCGHNWKEAH